MRILFILIISSFFILACKNRKSEDTTVTIQDSTAIELKYILTPFTPSQEYADASLSSMEYKNGKFKAAIGGSTYKLGEQTPDAPLKQCANSAEGQHIHLIVDNEPYIAKYTNEFEHDIADGEHYVLSFLSRSYHESLKSPAAYKLIKATVKDKSYIKTDSVSGPMLFYSRPKGLYSGDDKKKVMLDYYLVNTGGGKYLVEADINGEKHILSTWEPYYIEGLPDGDNTITLSLLNSDSTVVKTPLNPVTRTFQLEKTPPTN
ncbi:MAG TPA: hypothetical protein VEA37_05055 [Flavobacterium sp.]|nr:hypothetical protein [Flavobacterium sp.]